MRSSFGFQPDYDRLGTKIDSLDTSSDAYAERIGTFLKSVYAWMFVGLGLTGIVAHLVASTPALIQMIFGNMLLFWGLVLVELGLVFVLSRQVRTMEPSIAAGLFLLYAALNGVTLSFLLLVYTGASLFSTFIVAAGMFAAMAVYGATTTKSLLGYGQYFLMGLIGLILASVVGFFWHSDALQFAISVFGVLLFTGLTAYDNQRLKQMSLDLPGDRTSVYAVVGALSLYLDFVNMFIFLLRLMGRRR